MIQKDRAKGFDIDIMQCKKDIELARQSETWAEIKTHKDKKKEQTSESQVSSGEQIRPSAVEKPTQLFNGQKKTNTEINSGFPAREQTRYVTKTLHIDQTNRNQTNATPTSESISESSADMVKIEKELPSAVEDYGTKYEETPEIKPVTAKKKATEGINPAGKPEDDRPIEKPENTQSNEVEFIKQVKSMKSDNNRTNRREVPRFDLAEQIMAEQRKNSATRRKAPGRKNSSIEEQQDSNYKPTYQSKQESTCEEEQFFSAKQEIIAIIVKRDFERLCKNGDSRGK